MSLEMSLVYHWRREKLITLKAQNSSFSPSFIIIKLSVIGQFSPIFYSCFVTHGENMPVYSVDCCSMSHTWRRQRIKKDVQVDTHIQTLKAHINIGDRRKSNKLCANIKETLTEGMILTSMFYLEEMHRPNWVFQITAIVMILVELTLSIKYWKTNNENYSCKMYIEEVSADIRVESGKKVLAYKLFFLQGCVVGEERFILESCPCSIGWSPAVLLYIGCRWHMPLIFLW